MKQVRAGYKETEVGVIPEDWEVKELSEGLTLTSSKRIFEKDYVPSGIPFYRGKEISQLRKSKNIDDLLFIGYEKYLDIKNRFGVPKEGDLLITSVGTLGNVYLVKNNSPFYFKDGNLIWIKDIKNSVPLYLLFLLEKNRNRVIDTAIGSSQKALTIVSLGKLRLPLPPTLAEQEKIATALSDTDSYIEKLEKLIEKKKYIKTGAMQELLTGKKRLPGFGKGKGSKETPVGVIPEDWEVKRLGDVADKELDYSLTGGPFGSNLKSSDYTSQGVRIIQLQNIGDGKFFDSYKIFTSEKKAQELSSCCIYPDEIILSKMGDPVARACLIPFTSKKFLMCSDGIRLVVDRKNFSNKYILFTINFDVFRNSANLSSIGSTRKRIGLNDLRRLPIPLPPTLAEQEKIAEVLSDMDSEIEKLEVKLDKYKNIKQGMMQKLLTGAVRLV